MTEAEVVVQLRTVPQRATAGGGPAAGDVRTVRALLKGRFGAGVEPLHPGVGDPALRGWHRVAVPADVDAEAVAAALRALPEVEAAYVKPPADLP
ncbi:hypothetical protein ABCR94_08965 [Streptomyces sp. 21So2-11]|uniref:hypothetical protein n=1 Tax=Streptomyces sp. 21So2-11 TaxID=3144408 RepID=UPI00321C305B